MTTIDYIEIYFKCKDDVCLTENYFYKLFDYLRTKPIKNLSSFFNKTVYKEYYKDLVLEQVFDSNQDFHSNQIPSKESVTSYIPILVMEDSPLHELKNEDTITTFYKKSGHSLCTFPSTKKIYDALCEQRFTFKINNRIYLNLCKVEYMSEMGTIRYYVNIHYQHKQNCDVLNDIACIQQLSTLITAHK